MPETLLSPSQVKLYGREFTAFKVVKPTVRDVTPDAPSDDDPIEDCKESDRLGRPAEPITHNHLITR